MPRLACSTSSARTATLSRTALFWSRARLLLVRCRLYVSGAYWSLICQTTPDAQGDVLRGLQVVESALAVTTSVMGDKLEGKALSLISHSKH